MAVGSPLRPSTRVFKAYCVQTRKLVLLKDTWMLVSNSQTPEHMMYEKLEKHGVRNICTCKEGCDVLDQFTKTPFFAIAAIAAPSTEMVTAVRDGITAHEDAYDKAEILHRDISSADIIITNTGGGFLIDWDLCKKLQHIHQRTSTH
ncbi:hypothetical protein BU17DRAFT_89702 [Hysterangium stoloniferum]|nr:hypothetical protein BU17DRAFT_89702 [Hysterangium stoloniferum]